MLTYRRTGGALAIVALAATTLIAALMVAATLFVVSLIAAAVLLARAVLPRAWRYRIVPQAASWPHETLEATVVATRPDDLASAPERSYAAHASLS